MLTTQLDKAVTLFLYVIIIQFMLGMLTLIWVVPVWLGVIHQTGAFLLVAVAVYNYFLISNVKQTT